MMVRRERERERRKDWYMIYFTLCLGSFATPRLELPIQNASVTIIDAQGGAGVFQFVSSSTIIHEDGSPLVQALINRTSGTAGTVTVQLSIVEARADGTTRKFMPAIFSQHHFLST